MLSLVVAINIMTAANLRDELFIANLISSLFGTFYSSRSGGLEL